MVNEILVSIAKALKDYTGQKVYVDTVEQGTAEPYFLLKFLSAQRINMLSDRVRIKSRFQIIYLADNAETINNMAETLPFDIKRLTVSVVENDTAKTLVLNASNIDIHADQDEHTLVCLADYIYTSTLVENNPDLMLTATINEEVYNGEKQ